MDDTWEPDASWLNTQEGFLDGDELEPLDEVALRLRSYRRGDLHAYLSPAVRKEQGPSSLRPGARQ